MKILFWNTQRLGGKSDKDRISVLHGLVDGEKADVNLYCELTQQCDAPSPINLNYRTKNKYQLCYGARNAKGDMPITIANIEITDDYALAKYKGGKAFKKITSRCVGSVGTQGDVEVFFFHAPASHNAIKAVSFAACSLNKRFGDEPWMLIGDLNVEPDELAKAKVGIDLSGLIKRSGRATHSKGKELDYALTNITALTVKRVDVVLETAGSDHYPIVAEY